MKEIRETKYVEQTTVKFVAVDGKEFEKEQECVQYERRMNADKVKKAFDKLVIKPITIPMTCAFNDSNMYLIRVRNQDDLDALLDYAETENGYFDSYVRDTLGKDVKFPFKALYVSAECWCDVFYVNKIDKLKEELQASLEALD